MLFVMYIYAKDDNLFVLKSAGLCVYVVKSHVFFAFFHFLSIFDALSTNYYVSTAALRAVGV